jgi:glycosyltransferase involved in cell wall biosynthesis
LVKGALSIAILRSMRNRGFDVTIAFRLDASNIYIADSLDDFIAEKALIDLTKLSLPECLPFLKDEIDKREIDLILQIGAFDLYHLLPYLKEHKPRLRIIDTLYNEYGHTLNHFLYEECIDGVIVESDSMRRFVERATAKENPNIQTLTSGIDLEMFVPNQHRTCELELVIGYVGRMSDEKNPLGFVDLAETVVDSVSNVKFRMFGTGDQSEVVRKRVDQSRIRSKLTFEGYIENVEDALRQIDILILPSKFDGRPNIIMQANACGVPVIAAPVGGVPEMICEGKNGYLVDPQDTARICVLLSNWINAPHILMELKRSSNTFAISNFSSRRMFDDYAAALIAFTLN